MVNLKTQLRAFTAKQLAKGLGVSERTARRYRKSGNIPKARARDFGDWKKTHVAPTRAGEKRVLAMPAPELAAYAGVTPRTAKKWKREGKLPQLKKAELLTVIEPTPEPRQLFTRRQTFKGRISEGAFYETQVGAEVNASLISKVAAWGSKVPFKKAKGRNIQYVAEIKSDLALDDVLPGKNYPVIINGKAALEVKGGRQKGTHTVTSLAYGNRARALGDFLDELQGLSEYDVEIVSVTAIERDHWK